ncbi:hypothetical protein [Thioclava indica]|uniref:Type IV pilus biogenesis protein PilP n=1 Tax=Thioclava indica TaxID=1353528 RepID=A0A074JYK1_9RHOB|nr:hypothetical protein [Thioclava indica]KEO60980.1 hypothetical protein DT23_11360 [Thioclava indica]
MKPEFALILSHDGIGLAHRTRAGWARLGEVSLEAADLAGELAALRRQAQSLAPKGVMAKLVIPASQILYTAIYAPGPSPAQRRTQIEAALEGMTPYQVSDLVYDWVGTRQTVQVAVVARETLVEAEAFAQSHGFAPICFVAIPMAGDFTGEPWFGLSANAANYLPEGAQVERDMMPLAEFTQQPPEPQDADVAPVSEAEPVAEIEPARVEEPSEAPAEIDTATAPDLAQADEAVEAESAGHEQAEDAAKADPDVETMTTDAAQTEAEPDAEIAAEPEAQIEPDAPIEDALPKVTDAPLDPTPPREPAAPDLPPEDTQTAAPDASAATQTPDPVDPPEEISQDDLADLAALDQPASPPVKAPEPAQNDAANDAPDLTPEPAEPEAAQSTAKPLSSEAIAALAAVSAFSSSRAAKGQSTAEQNPDAQTPSEPTHANVPKLGGVGRLSPPQPERKKILTGEAGITAPGLDLPDSEPVSDSQTALKSGKNTLKQVAKKGLSGTAALGAVALSAKARMAKATPTKNAPRKPAQSAVEPPAETTVFGAQKRRDVGGKPRYLGASLIGALVLFLAIIALWTNFLSDESAPAPQDQIAVVPPAALTPDVPAASTPMVASTPTPPAPETQIASPPAPAPETPDTNAPEPAGDTQTAALPPLPPSEMPAFDAPPLPPPSAPQESATVAPEPAPPAAPLVTPTPEGVPMPGGFTLFAGKPDIVPGTRPESVAQAWSATQPPAPLRPSDTLAALPELAAFRPTSRPAALATPAAVTPAAVTPAPLPAANDPALAEARPVLRPAAISSKAQSAPDEDAALTPAPTVADTRLAGLRPDARPESVQSSAQPAPAAADAPSDPFADASPLAVAASARPPIKPRNFARSVESALAAAIAAEPAPSRPTAAAAPARKAAPVEIDEPEPVKPAPRLPTSASVARQATEKNVINLRQVNLIGLYGSSSSRRALVRLKNGKFVKVGVGDRLDGGRVTAIGSTQLTYAKGSRSYTLQLP